MLRSQGEGIDDLIIGAEAAHAYAGESYVVFGDASWGSQIVPEPTSALLLAGSLAALIRRRRRRG